MRCRQESDPATDSRQNIIAKYLFRVNYFVKIINTLETKLVKRAEVYTFADKFSFLCNLRATDAEIKEVNIRKGEYPEDIDDNRIDELRHFFSMLSQESK